MYKNTWVHYLTKVLVDVMFYGGILCFIVLLFVMPKLTITFGYRPIAVVPLTIVLMSSGLCAIYILFNLKQMLKTLIGGNPFVLENVSCLRKCAVASLLIAIIYLIKISFWFTMATGLIVIIFSLLGLFCLTLKDLFKQAVYYKEENDGVI